MVKKLDLAAKDNAKTYRIVQLNGVDPSVAQQIVDALQGRASSVPSSGSGSSLIPGGVIHSWRHVQPGRQVQVGGPLPTGRAGRQFRERAVQEDEDAAASGSRTAKDEGRIFLKTGSWMTLSRSSSIRNKAPRPRTTTTTTAARAVRSSPSGMTRLQPPPPPQPPPGAELIQAPRTPVIAIAVGPTGQIILSGTNCRGRGACLQSAATDPEAGPQDQHQDRTGAAGEGRRGRCRRPCSPSCSHGSSSIRPTAS